MASRLFVSIAGFCGSIACCVAHAQTTQDYPSRPLRLLIPSPPGGPSDFAAKLQADVPWFRKIMAQAGLPQL